MQKLDVDGVTFSFPDGLLVSKYDTWAFYRHGMQRIDGVKAIDLLVVDPARSTAYLIEVKDYRLDPKTGDRRTRTKLTDLADEMAAKVVHTLAGILAARTRATDTAEKKLSDDACKMQFLKVVMHLEQSTGPGAFRQIINPSTLYMKMRRLLKAIDPHPVVMSSRTLGTVPWVAK